jgi:hypothetical protein
MDFWETVQRFGPLGAALLFALLTNYWGMWLTKPNHDAIVKGKDERIAAMTLRLQEETARWSAVEQRLLAERDRAIALAMEGWERADHVLDLNGVPKPSPLPHPPRRPAAARRGAAE